jgi:hypothetical protein
MELVRKTTFKQRRYKVDNLEEYIDGTESIKLPGTYWYRGIEVEVAGVIVDKPSLNREGVIISGDQRRIEGTWKSATSYEDIMRNQGLCIGDTVNAVLNYDLRTKRTSILSLRKP